MSKAQEHLTLATANTATGGTALFGGVAFLNENAAAIGAICAIISLIVAIVFYVLNYRLRKRETEASVEKITEEVIGQILSQRPELSDAINKVKNRRSR